MKKIAVLLCGQCPERGRRVIGHIHDGADGPTLTASLRRPSEPPHLTAQLRELNPDTKPPPSVRTTYEQTPLSEFTRLTPAEIGCPKHTWGVFMPEYLAEIVAEYRMSGRIVRRVVPFEREDPRG